MLKLLSYKSTQLFDCVLLYINIQKQIKFLQFPSGFFHFFFLFFVSGALVYIFIYFFIFCGWMHTDTKGS